MFSSNNDQLIARETALPGLKLLLDANRFARVWSADQALPQVSAATIQYVRYKPGRRCIVVYVVRTSKAEHQVVATAYNREGWLKHVHTFDDATCDTNPNVQSDLTLLWVSAATFPRDRNLRLLKELRTRRDAQKFVRSFVSKKIDDEHFLLQCVAYKPGRRAVFNVQTSPTRRYSLKIIESSTFEHSRLPAEAWENRRQYLADRGVELPPLIRADSKRKMIVSRWLGGYSLAEQMSAVASDTDVFYRVGSALGELHRSHPIGLVDSRDCQRAEQLTRLASDVATLVPELSSLAHFFASEIENRLSVLPKARAAIHGDFDAKQVCVDDSSIGIVDFDQSVLDNPLRDVGNFIAKLLWRAYCGDLDLTKVAEIEDSFLRGYSHRCGIQDRAEVELHVAVGLFKCVTHPFRGGMENWQGHISDILDLVSERFNRHRTNNSYASRDDKNARKVSNLLRAYGSSPSRLKQTLLRDSPTPWMASALIPEQAKEKIARTCPEFSRFGERLEVDRIEPVRYKPGRRCLIRYDLRIVQSQTPDQMISILGKLRFKGVDKHGYKVQQQLYEHGFNDSSIDGIAVPRTLGIDPNAHIWYQECVSGQSMEQLVASGDEIVLPNASERIANALVTLHRVSITHPLKSYTSDDEVHSLVGRLQSVACEQPKHKAAIGELIATANRLSRYLGSEPSVAIHRDFHPSQILLTPQRLYLLDFDLFCNGPATLDAGNFLAHLWELSIRDPSQGVWQREAKEFTDHYHAMIHPGHSSTHDLDAWSWLALARHVWISTRILERSAVTETLIDASLAMAKQWVR